MRTFSLFLLLAAMAAADFDGLVFVGLNEHGAEEWVRARDGATMIRVPGGEYLRREYEGGPASEKPKPFAVKSFFIDKHEVTNDQFARFLNATAKVGQFVNIGVPGIERTAAGWRAQAGMARHPVTAATGYGALAFAEWVGGRLPEPHEWEKAAGGPKGLMFPWGNAAPDASRANGGRVKLTGVTAVGSFPKGTSPYGCLDMAGNAYERVMTRGQPVMIKGGAWLSPNPLNLRVLDMCMQPAAVADRSVGFRCVVSDPQPDRPVKKAAAKPAILRIARSWEAAVAEAKKRRVPIFVSLHFDTCGQCDRTREQLFKDARFVAYCNAKMVVVVGCSPAPQFGVEPHDSNEDNTCPLFDGIECRTHYRAFDAALQVVKVFRMSPGNFILHPDRAVKDAGHKAILAGEEQLPKWGNPVAAYLAAFERARAQVK